jgi:hypothetical protein
MEYLGSIQISGLITDYGLTAGRGVLELFFMADGQRVKKGVENNCKKI